MVGSECCDDGNKHECNYSGERCHLRFLNLGLTILTTRTIVMTATSLTILTTLSSLIPTNGEEISMGLELEDEVGDVDEEEQDGSPTGDDEKARFAAFCNFSRLARLRHEIEHTFPGSLGHEICSRDDERFCRPSKPTKNFQKWKEY